jgi:hypothetical protein
MSKKVCHFNNTSSSQTVRIYLVIVVKKDTFAYLFRPIHEPTRHSQSSTLPNFLVNYLDLQLFILNKILSVQQMPQVARVK